MSQIDFNREVKRLTDIGNGEAFTHAIASQAVSIKEQSSFDYKKYKECFFLTISSTVFRVVTIVHLTNDAESKAFVAEAINANVTATDDEKFYDYMGELGNTLCGSVKRNLNKFVPSLGMSTPNRLKSECLKFIQSQAPVYNYHCVVTCGSKELFATSVYVFADQELDYDINAVLANVEEEESGELEMF
jgi:hypothetical protein